MIFITYLVNSMNFEIERRISGRRHFIDSLLNKGSSYRTIVSSSVTMESKMGFWSSPHIFKNEHAHSTPGSRCRAKRESDGQG